ncbi:MAG: hypothetical protein FJ109_13510, partial [Deltaproteobacteria bacterium]|nr:hypothetical protein [Deltaproteobacteria bacterium]
MRKSLVLLGKLATRLASALFLALPLVPGCNGCNPEPDGDVIGDVAPDVVQVVCQQDGLYLDGVLVVPSDPMADPSPECESSSIRFEDATRFHACCGEVCCDFDGDRPIGKKEGSPCTSTDECQSGLTCVPSGDQWTCRYGREGDPCDVDHQCGTGLYCNPFGACRKPVDEEGAGCQVSDEQCAWPMSCVCRVSECACYDGTSGDPCESDTCGEGLYCLAPQGGKDAICFEGVAGDPCKYDWQCDN